MAFTDNPYNVVDRMRMITGDTDPEYALISDEWYNYYFEQSNNETTAAMEVARKILVLYTGFTREREGSVERYGAEKFSNYLEWLKTVLTDSTLTVTSAPIPYAGGTSISDMFSNESNADNTRLRIRQSLFSSPYVTEEDPYTLQG